MQNHVKSAVAGGNIRRGRVLFFSDDNIVLEASVNTSFPPAGIAGTNSRWAPGTAFDTSLFHATSGQEVLVATNGAEALAECGNTVTAGKAVTYDSTARVVNSTLGGATSLPVLQAFEIGTALEDGTAGDLVRIRVQPQRAVTS